MSSNVVPLIRERSGGAPGELETYLKIFEHSKDSVFLISPDTGAVVFANPKAVEDTSYENSELVNLDFKTLFLPEEQAAIKTLLEATAQWNTGVDPQRVLKRKTGRKIIVEISSSIVEFEGKKTIFCNVRDITARVKSEEKIKQYSKELETINAELEDRVKARTAELSRINKELDDVMANIQQAIFTLSPENLVNPEHSRFAKEVFGERSIAGTGIAELLFEPEAREATGGALAESLQLVYQQPDAWELVRDLMPREIRYQRPSAAGTKEARDLKIEWFPILSGGAIVKMMVICLDVTEQKRLQAEIAKKEAQHQEQLELIAQIISLPPEIVAQFVKDTRRLLTDTHEQLALAKNGLTPSIVDGLLRNLHTIKGSSRQFKLNSVQKRAHELETKLAGARGAVPGSAAGLALIEKIDEEFKPIDALLQDILSLYDKTTGSKGAPATGDETLAVARHRYDELLQTVSCAENGMLHVRPVRDATLALAVAPVRKLFDRLEALAAGLAEELGRKVEVSRVGDGVCIDSRFEGALYDGLLHAIRNSIDHGCEDAESRAAAGKKDALKISLSASRRDDGILLEVADDGAGVLVEKVREKAVKAGLAAEDELRHLSPDKTIQLVFSAGFSTKDAVTELSGRGVGLDVVKMTAEKTLLGDAALYSSPGSGTRLALRFPPNEPLKGRAPTITDSGHINESWTSGGASPRNVVCFDSLEPEALVGAFATSEKLRHFVDSENRMSREFLRRTTNKISGGCFWGVEPYLWAGAPVTTHRLTDYGTKNQVIERLLETTQSLHAFAGLPEIAGTIADEMIMNAMFDAPRDANGKEKYNHLPRTHRLVLEPREAVTFRYGADPDVLCLSIEDPFGALSHSTLVRYLAKCYAKGKDQIDQKQGGAGLGLFTIFKDGHCMVVNCAPGRRTEIISVIFLSRSHQKYEETRKSLSYFEE